MKLLKLSGEALGAAEGIFDRVKLMAVCSEIVAAIKASGEACAIVVGGGNIIRGGGLRGLADPTRGDRMGMLATLINALAVQDGIESVGGSAVVMGPQEIPNVSRAFVRADALAALAKGTVVVFGGGTGNPFFTTDTAAALRAAEIGASEVLKGSKVDGIYTADPRKDPSATRIPYLTFDQAVDGRYGVMDLAAFALCRDNRIRIRVFDMTVPGSIRAALGINPPGTLVGPAE